MSDVCPEPALLGSMDTTPGSVAEVADAGNVLGDYGNGRRNAHAQLRRLAVIIPGRMPLNIAAVVLRTPPSRYRMGRGPA